MLGDLFDLSKRVAIVTGATGLLGHQHCDCLAQAGANVVALDLDSVRCEELAQKLTERYGVEAMGIAGDVTDPESLKAIRQTILQRYGRIDILVNNAAVDDKVVTTLGNTDETAFENYPLEMFRHCLDINVTGVFLCCQIFGSPMKTRGQGSIINIASMYALVAPDQRLYTDPTGIQTFYKSPVYPASKGAVVALTRFLASYWGADGVRVNTLSPGGVQHEQPEHFVKAYSQRTPLGRMAQSSDYRGALLYLASNASKYMTGSNLVVDGGWTVW